jgi:N-acetylglucosaminyldiphosphoundecaprenol N-acetyl-beta-D-mannosaminyltransferase
MTGGRTRLAGLEFHRLNEAEVVGHVIEASLAGRGGWVVTPNIDICRLARRDRGLRGLVAGASLVVPDGMPLVWAARLRGDPLPERVAGGSLIYSLSRAAATRGRSVYFLGGAPGVPQRAGRELAARYPGLAVAGAEAPPFGFDTDPQAIEAIRRRISAAGPDIVYVGLGCPKQERLIAQLLPSFPATWFLACGAAIGYAAGTLPRAPRWMRQAGLSWLFRLTHEPRRLLRRYLVHDLPFAARLLLVSAVAGRFLPSPRRDAAGPAGIPRPAPAAGDAAGAGPAAASRPAPPPPPGQPALSPGESTLSAGEGALSAAESALSAGEAAGALHVPGQRGQQPGVDLS